MAYVAVRGGAKAIEASLERLKYDRLKMGSPLDVDQAASGLGALIDQVMSEASLYDREVAALAVKQAEGSPEEAVFLLRAFRSTVERLYQTRPAAGEELLVERRLSAAFKDIPGGQWLGATTDYSHRLIDFTLGEETPEAVKDWVARVEAAWAAEAGSGEGRKTFPKVVDYLRSQGLLDLVPDDDRPPLDVTKGGLTFPTTRAQRLQTLSRGQTGTVTALGYASLRGYGALHPTVGELRVGRLPLVVDPSGAEPSEDEGYFIGEVRVTEVETIVPVETDGGEGRTVLSFDLGYGLCFGKNETKTIAMSLLDQVLEGGRNAGPLSDEEFVLLHVDSVEATGFISHLKLPHYVTFQSKLEGVRQTRQTGEKR
jgi:alpha-D-ribose 1-methylphosphonate 5-triphosphate synthase subunit PhnI